jgi:hypothetical protein
MRITEPEENAVLRHIVKLYSKGNCMNNYGKPVHYILFPELLKCSNCDYIG